MKGELSQGKELNHKKERRKRVASVISVSMRIVDMSEKGVSEIDMSENDTENEREGSIVVEGGENRVKDATGMLPSLLLIVRGEMTADTEGPLVRRELTRKRTSILRWHME